MSVAITPSLSNMTGWGGSAEVITPLLPTLISWEAAKEVYTFPVWKEGDCIWPRKEDHPIDNCAYTFKKTNEFKKTKKLNDLKIQDLSIHFIRYVTYGILYVGVKTDKMDTYLKVVEVAQNYFQDKSKYHFYSTYSSFPLDENGLCTFEAVKNIYPNFEQERRESLFRNTHLAQHLFYRSRYTTNEERSTRLTDALSVVGNADETVKEINGCLEFLLKV